MIEEIKKRLAELTGVTGTESVANDNSNVIHRVNELASIFAQYVEFQSSVSLDQKIYETLDSRLAKILKDEMPMISEDTPRIVLQMCPIASFEMPQAFDMSKVEQLRPQPLYSSGWSTRHNFDGVLTYSHSDQSDTIPTYTQYYYDGSIEAVDTLILSYGNAIPSVAFEQCIIEFVQRSLEVYKMLGVQTPIVLSLNLIKVKGMTMALPQSVWMLESSKIQEENLQPPYIKIDDLDTDVGKVLKPVFDRIWRACGQNGSLNYDQKGNWLPRR